MTLIELLAVVWSLIGLCNGIAIAAHYHYSGWWMALAALLGVVAGLVLHAVTVGSFLIYMRLKEKQNRKR
jgi:uncharacterized membrane protein HdeD (DUF308 family)